MREILKRVANLAVDVSEATRVAAYWEERKDQKPQSKDRKRGEVPAENSRGSGQGSTSSMIFQNKTSGTVLFYAAS